jgi:hypothetical protein
MGQKAKGLVIKISKREPRELKQKEDGANNL